MITKTHNENTMVLDKTLISVCNERNMTISALARATGIRQSTIHGWVTGRSVQKPDDLRKVCDVLQVSMFYLMFGSEDPWHNRYQAGVKIHSYMGENLGASN